MQVGVTTYFRNSFVVPFREAVLSVRGDLRRDDGAVCYINGIEVSVSARHIYHVSSCVLLGGGCGWAWGRCPQDGDESKIAALPHACVRVLVL